MEAEMSLEHFDDRRKGMSRRAREMAKAAKVVGPKVRQVAMYDKDSNKKVELAKLLALNVEQPGAFGHFIGEVRVPTPSGGERKVVRRGGVKDMLLKWTQEAKNPLEGWPLEAMAAAMGIDRRDSRLRKRTKAMTNACAKLGFAAEPYQGRFKILTVPEAAVKQEQQRASIEGQIKARSRKSKPLQVGGFEPTGKQNLQLAWWDMPQFKALEGGAG
jgi:hypothetical protein